MEIEITITTLKKISRVIVLIALLVVLYFAGKWAWPQVSGLLPGSHATPTPTPDLAMQAAVEGVEAFFSIDASKGVDAWVKRMCSLTTPEGCVVYQVILKGWAQKQIKSHPDLNNTATVEQVEFVGETSRNGEAYRLYRVVVHFSSPWDGVEGLEGDTLTAYALLQKDDNNVWRFAAPLNEQDAQRYMPKQ